MKPTENQHVDMSELQATAANGYQYVVIHGGNRCLT